MRFVLALVGVIFAIIGIGFLTWPVSWAAAVEVQLPTAMGRIDVRATYGGFCLAFGVWLLFAACVAPYSRAGLLCCALVLAGFAFGRALGAALEGTLPRLMAFFLAVEVAGAVVTFLGWRAYGRMG
jgi:hypothetical protein